MKHLAVTVICLASVVPSLADDDFQVEELKYSGGPYKNETFRYIVMRPAKVEAGKSYPLVLFLHGAGERGTDTKLLQRHLPEMMASADYRGRFPCYFVAPQCRKDKRWVDKHWGDKQSTPMKKEPTHQLNVAVLALKASLKEYSIDESRIYLTGLSMGGFGSWELAVRNPDWFAAVAPICGGGDIKQAHRLKNVPVWAAHGDKDGVVIPERSREMIAAIKKAGGKPYYVEYPGVGHNSWTPAYKQKDGLLKWMFEQRKTNPAKIQ